MWSPSEPGPELGSALRSVSSVLSSACFYLWGRVVSRPGWRGWMRSCCLCDLESRSGKKAKTILGSVRNHREIYLEQFLGRKQEEEGVWAVLTDASAFPKASPVWELLAAPLCARLAVTHTQTHTHTQGKRLMYPCKKQLFTAFLIIHRFYWHKVIIKRENYSFHFGKQGSESNIFNRKILLVVIHPPFCSSFNQGDSILYGFGKKWMLSSWMSNNLIQFGLNFMTASI